MGILFEPKRKCSNRVWAGKNAEHQVLCMVKRQSAVKNVLYGGFFDNKGPVMRISVPKGRIVTGAFYKNVVLKKVEGTLQETPPKIGSKHLCLLYDNAPAHKARNVTELIIFCFPNSNSICLEKR